VMKHLPWSHIADRLKYDLLPDAHKLSMPTLLIVGENDTSTPPDQARILYDALPGPKELHIIVGAPHTFRSADHLGELKTTIRQWIRQCLLK